MRDARDTRDTRDTRHTRYTRHTGAGRSADLSDARQAGADGAAGAFHALHTLHTLRTLRRRCCRRAASFAARPLQRTTSRSACAIPAYRIPPASRATVTAPLALIARSVSGSVAYDSTVPTSSRGRPHGSRRVWRSRRRGSQRHGGRERCMATRTRMRCSCSRRSSTCRR